MKIKEFQEAIAKELNTLDELVQGGCKAFASSAARSPPSRECSRAS